MKIKNRKLFAFIFTAILLIGELILFGIFKIKDTIAITIITATGPYLYVTSRAIGRVCNQAKLILQR